MERPIRALIADDHAPARSGIRAALEAGGFEICGEAPDADGAIALAEAERPDVCVLDVQMPGGGVHAAREIARLSPESAVVMLTVSIDERDLLGAIEAGAVGYLLKDTSTERLPMALRGVMSGEAAIPRWLVSRLVSEVANRGRRRRVALADGGTMSLTQRELQVLELAGEGLTTAEIAERLAVSVITVRRHISSAVQRLGVADRGEAVSRLRFGDN